MAWKNSGGGWCGRAGQLGSLEPDADHVIIGNGDEWETRDPASMRTTLALVPGVNVQAYDVELAALASLTSAADRAPYFTGLGTAAVATLTAAGRALIDDASASDMRTTLGLAIGVDVQAYDAELAALAGVTSAADRVPYFTGSGTASVATMTAAARALIDDATAADMRTTLGVAIGSNVQAYDADLAAIAALSTNGVAVRTATSTWAVRSLAAGTGLSWTNADGVSGNPTLALSANLSTISGITTDGFAVRKSDGSWLTRSVTAGDGILVSNGNGASGNTVISAISAFGSITNDLDSNASSSPYNPFDSDNTTSYTSTALCTAQGVTYVAGSGRWAVAAAGTYKLDATVVLVGSAATDVKVEIRQGGSSVWSTIVRVATTPTPVTVSAILEITLLGYVEVWVDSQSAATVLARAGGLFGIHRVGMV